MPLTIKYDLIELSAKISLLTIDLEHVKDIG